MWLSAVVKVVDLCASSAFLSALVQARALFGEAGLDPISSRVADAAEAPFKWLFATLIHSTGLPAVDVLELFLILGLLSSLWLLFSKSEQLQRGWRCFLCRWSSFLCYSILLSHGGTFMSFQWDSLLVEIMWLLAITVWPFNSERREGSSPTTTFIWLARLLLFKLMLMSGFVKLDSGCRTWRELTATEYHYATQPLPGPLASYAAHISRGLHKLSVAGTLWLELPACLFILAPSPLMAGFAAGSQTLLQLGIMLTGSYTFFNALTAALALLCAGGCWWQLGAGKGSGSGERKRWGWLLLSVVEAAAASAFIFLSIAAMFRIDGEQAESLFPQLMQQFVGEDGTEAMETSFFLQPLLRVEALLRSLALRSLWRDSSLLKALARALLPTIITVELLLLAVAIVVSLYRQLMSIWGPMLRKSWQDGGTTGRGNRFEALLLLPLRVAAALFKTAFAWEMQWLAFCTFLASCLLLFSLSPSLLQWSVHGTAPDPFQQAVRPLLQLMQSYEGELRQLQGQQGQGGVQHLLSSLWLGASAMCLQGMRGFLAGPAPQLEQLWSSSAAAQVLGLPPNGLPQLFFHHYQRLGHPLHIVSGYGLFRHMTGVGPDAVDPVTGREDLAVAERPEIVLEGLWLPQDVNVTEAGLAAAAGGAAGGEGGRGGSISSMPPVLSFSVEDSLANADALQAHLHYLQQLQGKERGPSEPGSAASPSSSSFLFPRWLEIPFRYKPGSGWVSPRQAAPHQPRLDWQMWFAALRPQAIQGEAWLARLLELLLEGVPSAYELLDPVAYPVKRKLLLQAKGGTGGEADEREGKRKQVQKQVEVLALVPPLAIRLRRFSYDLKAPSGLLKVQKALLGKGKSVQAGEQQQEETGLTAAVLALANAVQGGGLQMQPPLQLLRKALLSSAELMRPALDAVSVLLHGVSAASAEPPEGTALPPAAADLLHLQGLTAREARHALFSALLGNSSKPAASSSLHSSLSAQQQWLRKPASSLQDYLPPHPTLGQHVLGLDPNIGPVVVKNDPRLLEAEGGKGEGESKRGQMRRAAWLSYGGSSTGKEEQCKAVLQQAREELQGALARAEQQCLADVRGSSRKDKRQQGRPSLAVSLFPTLSAVAEKAASALALASKLISKQLQLLLPSDSSLVWWLQEEGDTAAAALCRGTAVAARGAQRLLRAWHAVTSLVSSHGYGCGELARSSASTSSAAATLLSGRCSFRVARETTEAVSHSSLLLVPAPSSGASAADRGAASSGPLAAATAAPGNSYASLSKQVNRLLQACSKYQGLQELLEVQGSWAAVATSLSSGQALPVPSPASSPLLDLLQKQQQRQGQQQGQTVDVEVTRQVCLHGLLPISLALQAMKGEGLQMLSRLQEEQRLQKRCADFSAVSGEALSPLVVLPEGQLWSRTDGSSRGSTADASGAPTQ